MFKFKVGVFADETNRNLIGRVLRENFHLYVARYLLAFLLMGLAAAATGLSAFLMKYITAVVFGSPEKLKPSPATLAQAGKFGQDWLNRASDSVASHLAFSSPGMLQIFYVAVAIVVVFFVKGMGQYGSNVILSKIGNNIVARQQQRVSNHILNQSLAFFVHFPSSDLLTRVSRAASSARDVMNLLMMRVQDVFTAVALLLTMFKLDWQLSFCALFIMAPVTIVLGKLIKRIRKIANLEFAGMIQVISAVQEAIVGNKLIKSYNLEPHMSGRFSEAIGAVEARSNKMAVVSARTSPLMEFMGGLAVASIVFYGGYRNVVQGQSADSLIAFLTALLLAYEPIKRIARMNVSLHSSLVGVQMLYQVLDADYSIPDRPDAKPIRIHHGDIALRDVTFAYRPGLPVIHDLTLVCPGGYVTALVGPSGSGKTTLLNLIERFYSPDRGSLEIDGQEISHLTIASLRQQISLVSQDTFLFADTLRNNIRLAVDLERAAIRAVKALSLIHI